MSDETIHQTDYNNAVYQKFSRLVISPGAIAHNIGVIRSITGRTIIAIVKENGYGMGLLNEYQILKDLDIPFYAVTNTREALSLRSFGCTEPVLLMSPVADKILFCPWKLNGRFLSWTMYIRKPALRRMFT